jgi:hypothetical protein
MRSGWQPDARFMIVDAGRFGSAHGHEDKLNFELFAFGQPFIVESGTYTYVFNRWQRYFKSSFAHNIITIDGKSQLRSPDEDLWVSEPPEEMPNTWVTTEGYDYLEAIYDRGWGNIKEEMFFGPTHTRRILFVRPDYWIIWDTVDGNETRDLTLRYHLAAEPDVQLGDDGIIRANYADGPGIAIVQLQNNDIKASLVKGSEQPVQGWISSRYGSKIAAPVVEYHQKTELPSAFVTLLMPFDGQKDTHLTARLLPVSSDLTQLSSSDAIVIQVESVYSQDLIVLNPNQKDVAVAGVTTNHQLLIKRSFSDGAEQSFEREQL